MARPTLRAQVAFDTAPLAASPTWTTIHEGTTTQRVLAAQVRSGRGFELDAFQPGQMTLELENSDRRFDPLHASGPYFGKLLPRKRTRLQADWGTYLNLPGTGGAYTPDVAGLDIVGDIDIRCRVAPADWTPPATSVVVAKADITGQYSYVLALTSTGALQLAWTTTGLVAGILSATSTATVGATDGATRWVRATLDVDDGGGNRVVKFYTSTDDTHDHTAVTWTQLGSTVTTAGTTSIFSGSAVATIGATADAVAPLTGKVYAAAILSGIGGTVVAAPDFTDGNRFTAGAASGSDAAGRTWTVAAPAAFTAVTYPLFSGFVDTWPQDSQRFQGTADMAATDGFKVLGRVDLSGAIEETIRADTPTGWWRLGDDTAVSDLCSDSSGNGNDGRYVNNPTSVDSIVDGTSDGAVSFDGLNDKLDLPQVMPETVAGFTEYPFTWEMWIETSMVPAAEATILSAMDFFPGDLLFESVTIRLNADGTVTAGAYGHAVRPTSSTVCNDGRPHHIVVVADDADDDLHLYVDGVDEEQAPYTGPGAAKVLLPGWVRLAADRPNLTGYSKFNGAIDEVAFYDRALTAAQVGTHYNAGSEPWAGDTTGERIDRALTLTGWPAADRDIDTGRSPMGAYEGSDSNVLAIAQEAEQTEGGALWQSPDGKITFRDRHAPIQDWNATVSQAAFTDDGTATNPNHYTTLELSYDDTLIVNEVEVTWADGVETARDQASVDAYTRSATRIDTALRTAPEARDRADWLLARYAQPAVRPTKVILRPAADSRLWRHCLARRIGDRVTVRRKPQNTGTAIVLDATIESIAHRISNGRNTWETEFGLSPTAVDLGWLILDDTTEGLLDTGKVAF